jgi:hypothetical protein
MLKIGDEKPKRDILPKNKSVTRTFSIKMNLVAALEKEADNKGISTSSLMNQTIDRCVSTYWPSEKTNALVIAHDIVASLAGSISDENLREIAAITAHNHINTAQILMGIEPRLESVLTLLETSYGKNSRWYSWSKTVNGRDYRVLLIHELGQKWSVFLEAYMKCFFTEMLDIPVRSSYTDRSVVLEFRS